MNLPSHNLSVGDFVLVVDEKTQRGDWPLARVTRIFSGKDDTIHVCEVKTKYSLYKKPVAKHCLRSVHGNGLRKHWRENVATINILF